MSYLNEPHYDPFGVSWFTGKQFLEFELPEQQWLIKDLLTSKGRMLVYGDTGVHKSMVTLTLALNIVQGEVFMQRYPTRPGRVLYIGTSDMPIQDWKERFLKATAETNNNQLMIMPIEGNVSINTVDPEAPPQWVLAAREFAPDLVIVDVVNETHTLEANAVDMPSKVMNAWSGIFNEKRPAFVYVHHEKKAPLDPAIRNDPYYAKHAFSGSQKWQDLCAVSIRVVKDLKSHKRYLQLTKARHIPEEKKVDMPFNVNERLLVNLGDDAWARAWELMEGGKSAEEAARLIAGKSINLANALRKTEEIAEIMEAKAEFRTS